MEVVESDGVLSIELESTKFSTELEGSEASREGSIEGERTLLLISRRDNIERSETDENTRDVDDGVL